MLVATRLKQRLDWQIRLKTLMADGGISQTDLAPVFGVSRAAVNHYLSGRTEPSIDQISMVARHIGVSLDYLIYGETREHADVPLLSWDMIETYLNDAIIDAGQTDLTYLRCIVRSCSDRTFAVKVQGDSMDGNGGYRHGDVIFIDPDQQPEHDCDVIVKPAKQRMVLRRLSIHEDGTKYFRALNQYLPMNFEGPVEVARIYGVVIFSGCFRL